MLEALPTNLECHNFSKSLVFTNAHKTLLANGVKFVPTPRIMSAQTLQRHTEKFVNTVKWRAFFAPQSARLSSSSSSSKNQMPALYRPTGRTPPDPRDERTVNWIKDFQDRMRKLGEHRLCTKGSRPPPPPPLPPRRIERDRHLHCLNLRACERTALHELCTKSRFTRNPDGSLSPPQIVICNADKNLGLTIVDYAWFHDECVKQLSDRKFYAKLDPDVARQRIWAAYKHLTRLVVAGHRIDNPSDAPAKIDMNKLSDAQRFLLSRPPDHPQHRTPSFYVIPKIHKPRLVGRPITPAHRFCLAPACDFITKVLHPIVSLVPEILRDSTQLLLELEEPATLSIAPHEQEIYLITGDVESLYTNIPRQLCLKLLQQLPIPRVIIDLLELVFASCIVRFDNDFYLQIDGFPMGISPAPDVANLFMWLLLRRLALPSPPERRLYRRLIDDLLMVWVGPRKSLDEHLAAINALHPNIRITWTVSTESAAFLDLDIHLGDRFRDGHRRLDVRVHQKLLNRYLYIPALSFHKQSQHRAWIKAELLRLMRNTSSASDYKRIRSQFFARLLARGHAAKFLRAAFSLQWVRHSNRDVVLSSSQKSQDKAFERALEILYKITFDRDAYLAISKIPPSLSAQWTAWCKRDTPEHTPAPATPWPEIEELLLSEDLVRGALHRTLDFLHPLFTRNAPPPVFSLPLTSASSSFTWRQLALTQPPNIERNVLVVLLRPPSLGTLLRFRNPSHALPEPRRVDSIRAQNRPGQT